MGNAKKAEEELLEVIPPLLHCFLFLTIASCILVSSISLGTCIQIL